MERIEKTVFISYRRTDVSWALAIYQNLTQHGYDVFFDFKGIASGDFESVILENITARAHFLILLTPSALERCNDRADWLRREIETALNTQRNIVPVILDGFNFASPKIAGQLTGTLSAIKNYNALDVPPNYFDEAMERLRGRYLNIPLVAVLHPSSIAAKRVAAEQKEAAQAAPKVQKRELTAEQWFERAFRATDENERVRFCNEAIRLKPDYPEAFNLRGDARLLTMDPDGAINDCSEAIRLKPDYASAFHIRGDARQSKGDLDESIKDYSEAIRLQPHFALAFYNRGVARQMNGDLDGSKEDFKQAKRLEVAFGFDRFLRG